MSTGIRHVAVVGAGIGGLMSALALQRRGIRVTVLERDPAPPAGIAPADSMAWLRAGVPQSRHPHFFMGRLRLLLEREYPDLVARLFEAGASENALADYLHPSVRHRFRPRPGDDRLRSLNLRRTTFEMVVRDYVADQTGIRIHSGVRVNGLDIVGEGSPVTVRGVRRDGAEAIEADAVIDAAGRFSRLVGDLEHRGIIFDRDQRDSGLCYLTRHYQLLDGQAFPPSFGLPGGTFDDFVVGALPADNGAFTVTFQVYRDDAEVMRALKDPEHFQAMCLAVGALAPWVDPARARPTGAVHGFGHMDSFWQRSVVDGEPRILGLFGVGDSVLRSNPKFGRGCTWSTLAAHELARLLASELTPGARIRAYEQYLEATFRADWQTMRRLDRSTEAAFEIATGRRVPRLAERLGLAMDHWVSEALLTEPGLFREVWAGYHGLQSMTAWMRRPSCWLALARSRLASRRHRPLMAAQQRRPSRAALAATALTDHPLPHGS
ncbi:MAG: FAD-dependent oxidoreductase [Pseudomonadales bacterium]